MGFIPSGHRLRWSLRSWPSTPLPLASLLRAAEMIQQVRPLHRRRHLRLQRRRPSSRSCRICTATPSSPGRGRQPKRRGTAPAARRATAIRQSTPCLARSFSERSRTPGPRMTRSRSSSPRAGRRTRAASRLPGEAGEDGVHHHRRGAGNHRRTALRGVRPEREHDSRRTGLRVLHLRPAGEGSGDAGLVPFARQGRLV